MMDKILVMGCGTWGSALAQSLSVNGHKVVMWHYDETKLLEFNKTRRHPNLLNFKFEESIEFEYDIEKSVKKSKIIVLAVPSNAIRGIVKDIKTHLNDGHIIVNTSKGLEEKTFFTMSELISNELNPDLRKIVTLYGPSHAEEVAANQPTTLVSACTDVNIGKKVQAVFSSENIRVYTNKDIKGVELGGSLKNIIAIAIGICDGLGFGDNTKAALITRGMAEITRLGIKMGADQSTFSGLSGIGDLIATCLSKHSRNRFVGESIGSGKSLEEILESMDMVAEGVLTAKTINDLSNEHKVDMPISNAVNQVLFHDVDPKKFVISLMSRDLINESDN